MGTENDTVQTTARIGDTVSHNDFQQAMDLLGIDNRDPDRALVTVHIEAGRITATYATVSNVKAPD